MLLAILIIPIDIDMLAHRDRRCSANLQVGVLAPVRPGPLVPASVAPARLFVSVAILPGTIEQCLVVLLRTHNTGCGL